MAVGYIWALGNPLSPLRNVFRSGSAFARAARRTRALRPCQEIFDAAHTSPTGRNVMGRAGRDQQNMERTRRPWSEKSSAEVSGGKRDARAWRCTRSSPIPPSHLKPEAERTRQRARNPRSRAAAKPKPCRARARRIDFPGEGQAGSQPRVNRAEDEGT